MRAAIVGLGYVGLPLAVRAAEVGHSVMGVDADLRKISSLYAGRSYIEDVTDERLAAVNGLSLRVNQELLLSHRAFDICVVTVPTPLKNGVPDLSYVISAGENIGRVLDKGYGSCVVLESTSYPGTTEGPFAEAIARTSGGAVPGKDYLLGFSPERIDPGASEHTLENTPKLVSGTTPEALARIQEFYDTIVTETVPVSEPKVAELAKVLENLHAYANIALVNELADYCHALGIDVHEVIDAAMTKGHSISDWRPGPGVGGHCLPIDSVYAAWQAREQFGRPFKMAELAAQINNGRPRYVVDRAVGMLIERDIVPRDAKVLIMGVAYKPSVGDLRESPALDIVADLVGRGAQVTVVDPLVENWTMTPMVSVEELASSIKDFDLVVVVTDHVEFDFAKIASEAQQVLDTRNAVPATETVVRL